MTLTKCPFCKQPLEEAIIRGGRVLICTSCPVEPQKSLLKKKWFWVLVVLAITPFDELLIVWLIAWFMGWL